MLEFFLVKIKMSMEMNSVNAVFSVSGLLVLVGDSKAIFGIDIFVMLLEFVKLKRG